MIKIILILLTSLNSFGQVVSWSESENADGYILHWEIVNDCNSNFENYFRYSVDLSSALSHDVGLDANFVKNKKYAFKVSAYTETGLKSEQSVVFDCMDVDGMPKQVDKVLISKKKI